MIDCAGCPVGMECPFGSMTHNSGGAIEPSLKEFYWSSVAEPTNVFRCSSKFHCPGGPPGASCGKGLHGRACAACEQGWVWTGETCEECAGIEKTPILFPVLPLLLLPVIIVVMYKMFGDTYPKWGTWQNGISSGVFILLNHYQTTSIVKGANLVMPEKVSGMFDAFSFAGDTSTVFKPECTGFASFKNGLIVKTAGPAIVFIAFMATWSLSQLLGRALSKPALKMEPNRTMNGFFSLMFTFFAGIVDIAFVLFKCGPNPNGLKTLVADRSIICFEADWNSMLAIGLCGVVFWCFGFGSLFVRTVIVAPKYFSDPGVQMRWKFLFIKYRSDVHWWALVFVAKGILLNMGFMLLETGVAQVYWVMVIVTLYTALTVCFRPWRHIYINFIDGSAHFCLILVTAALMWFARDALEDPSILDDDMSNMVVAFASLCFPLSVPAIGMMIMGQATATGRAAKEKNIDGICKSIAAGSKFDEDKLKAFVSESSDMDFWFLLQASHVMNTELLTKKSRSGLSTKDLTAQGMAIPDSAPMKQQIVMV